MLSTEPTRTLGWSHSTSAGNPVKSANSSRAVSGSLVIWVKYGELSTSRSPKRSPAASRTKPIRRPATACGSRPSASRATNGTLEMLTMSASRPASERTRGPPPPIMIGGCGCCTGRGRPPYPCTRTNSPDQFSSSPWRLEVESHCGVLDFAPPGSDAHLQPTVGEQIKSRRFLGQDRRRVIVDAEHPATDAQRLAHRGRCSHRSNGGQVLPRSACGSLRGAWPQVVIGQEKR